MVIILALLLLLLLPRLEPLVYVNEQLAFLLPRVLYNRPAPRCEQHCDVESCAGACGGRCSTMVCVSVVSNSFSWEKTSAA